MSRPYRAKASLYEGFRSLLEKNFSNYLKGLGVKFLYEPCKLKYVIPAVNRNYIPDFVITNKKSLTGSDIRDIVVIETKGRLTARDAKKMILVREYNPEVIIKFVFPYDAIYHKGKKGRDGGKYRYSDWCVDNGFDFFVGQEPPKEWVEND